MKKIRSNTIYCCDNLKLLKKLPNNCIDLTVTSPPYDNLRSYKGYTFDFENIAKHLYRVAKLGGVIVWIVGDATIKGSETGTSFKQALYFKKVGFNLHDTMIYAKNNPVPLTHNRYEQYFEYMFIFSKGKPKTFNPIILECVRKTKYTDRTNSNKEQGSAIRNRKVKTKIKKHKIKGNIWFMSVANTRLNHPAIFPEKLAEDHILTWSNKKDLVFDPFLGSGTTLKMALLNKRKFIGCDISKEYCKIAKQRIKKFKI